MEANRVYKGIVRTGRSGAVKEMSIPGALEGFHRLTGLSIIPGTLNIKLTEYLDLSALSYLKFADVGWYFDPSTQGIDYNGEIGVYYSQALVADKYPACLLFFTWVTTPGIDAELVSPHHLRTVLNLEDGDIVEFMLSDK
jgi:CTP-dependent riboflavin kinase